MTSPVDGKAAASDKGSVAEVVTAEEIIARVVFDGASIMVGGFGFAGKPLTLVNALNASPFRDLTILSNNLGEPGKYLGQTLRLGKVRRAIGTYFTTNPDVGRAYLEGRIQVTLIPQGTFSEAIRAGGAGLGGFFTPTSAGTLLAEGKETRVINGKPYVFQEAITAELQSAKRTVFVQAYSFTSAPIA